MIVVNLTGGLGNQMFQYAVGRHLSMKHNVSLKFDISGYKNQNLRKIEIDNYNIDLKYLKKREKVFFNGVKIINKFLPVTFYYKEKKYSFDPNVLRINENCYLDGYWQSYKYFEEISEVIKNDFKLKTLLDDRNKKLLNDIINKNSVSIHFRRGDYITNSITNKYHGVCSINYYKKAKELILNGIANPYLVIFSDDTKWVKENFKITEQHIFVDWNTGKNSYKDIILMSNCKHNIIANSSFSWWAAWLNINLEKIVIAPKNWFANNNMNQQIQDLVPGSWRRI